MSKWDGWRKIEGFSDYTINSDGDIRNRHTWVVLKEQQSKQRGNWYYQMTDNRGKQTKRSYLPLLYKAWPELLEAWREIPGHEGYLIDREGNVMGKKFYRPIPRMTNNLTFTYNLHVWGSGGAKKRFDLLEFDWTVFDNYEEIIYYQKALEKAKGKKKRKKAEKKWRRITFLPSHLVNAQGEIRRDGDVSYRRIVVKEYFPVTQPGVLLLMISPNGPHAKKTYLRYDNIMNDAWPELREKKAA